MKGAIMNKPQWFERGTNRLKQEWAEHPLNVIAVGGIAATGLAKLIDATSASKGRKAYAKQVEYRVKTRR
jgi:hypothetical protein